MEFEWGYSDLKSVGSYNLSLKAGSEMALPS